jgi:hypothetical protein
MIDQLIKIADFLDKSGRKEDADLIDYVANKYASGDISAFLAKKSHLDIPDEEKEMLEDVLIGLAQALGKKI